ncbi:MAG TPA: PIN domain-containing protein [Rhodanobacteraceae bacterium]|nr:PIN domain-containing protein [Rhodanobacteraceae bacterium]
MRTNYVLIDYENVQPSALSALDKDFFKVFVFVGANQTKVNFDIVEALQRLGANGQYIKISGNGSNALDFHIAYFIGRLAAQDEAPFFHIISKDTGFDPLIAYLKANKIYACRSKSIHDIPIVKASSSGGLQERVAAVVANFKQRGNSRPRTPKTLSSTINAIFQKGLTDSEITGIIKALEQHGHIAISGNKVTYSLS